MLEAFFVSMAVVALGEIGDKTQLLSLVLAARFRQPWPILGGILAATLVNHTLAGALGAWLRTVVPPEALKWLVALSFFAVAIWALFPDSIDESTTATSRLGVFTVTTISFFLAEMGDKTQIATAILAARFDSLVAVVAGTTLGMLAADVPVVFLGKFAGGRLPLTAIRIAASITFLALGVWALLVDVGR